MARPQKKGMDYFPHDTDASSDEKVEALRSVYGNDGYAFYFILLERIYRTEDFELNVSDAETLQVLAKKVSVTLDRFQQMLASAIKWGCFDKEKYEKEGVLTSDGIKTRAGVVVEKRLNMRKKYDNKVSGVVSDAENGVETPQSKVKESKEKKSKYNMGRFTPPTLEEIKTYCLERNNQVDPQRFYDFYASKGWMVGKNKMKDWQAAVRTWEKGSTSPQRKTNVTFI